MFSTKVRNARILTASVRAAKAEAVVRRAEGARKRYDAAVKEIEWLKQAPVKDGDAGEGLPTVAEIQAHIDERLGKPEQDDAPQDDAAPQDDDNGPLFTSA